MKKGRVGIFHSMNLGDNYTQGGVQKVCIYSCLGFNDAGHRAVLIQHEGNTAISQIAAHRGIAVKNLKFEIPTLNNDYGGIGVRALLKKIAGVIWSNFALRLIHKDRYDILIFNDITSLFYIHAFRARKKYVFLHTERFSSIKVARFLVRWFPKAGIQYLSPTLQIEEAIKSVNKNAEVIRLQTPVFDEDEISTGIAPRSRTPDVLRLVYIGRISPNKNVKSLVELAKKINALMPCRLDIFGAPFTIEQEAYFEEVKSKIKSERLDDIVTLRGLTSEPIATFAEYDFSVILSDGEAIPLAGLESVRAGTPVLGWYAAGIDELIGENGIGIQFARDEKFENAADIVTKIRAFDPKQERFHAMIRQFTYQRFATNIAFEI